MNKINRADNIVLGIDIGTTSVKISASELVDVNDDEKLSSFSIEYPSSLTKKKFNENVVSEAIKNGVKRIEIQHALTFQSIKAVVTLPMHHYESAIRKVSISINNQVIRYEHKLELINKVKDSYPGGVIIHTIPLNYYIDGKPVKNPIGESGSELFAEIYVVYYDEFIFEKCKSIMSGLSINVGKYVAPPLSFLNLYQNVIPEKERADELIVFDCGGNASYIYYIYEGSLIKFAALHLGGETISNDIATVLKIDTQTAELFKINESSLAKLSLDQTINVGDQMISKNMLNEIVAARYEEIMEILEDKINLRESIAGESHIKFVLLGNGHPKNAVEFISNRWGVHVLDSSFIEDNRTVFTALGDIAYSINNEIFLPTETRQKDGFFRGIIKFIEDFF